MFKIADGRERLYQWDIDVKLLLDESATDIDGARFKSRFWREALFIPVTRTETEAYVTIPNILLQQSYDIIVYAYCSTDKCTKTVDTFEVEAKPKPSDYVYTETEILDYKTLEKRLKDLEGGGLAEAVANYLEENPVEAGATVEEAEQIKKNKEDISTLFDEKLSSEALPEAIETALAQAKTSGEFDGDPGEDGEDGITPHIGDNGNWWIGDTDTGKPSRGNDGDPGEDGYTPVKGVDYFDGEKGDPGDDYVLTESDKNEIAEIAAEMVDVPESGGGGIAVTGATVGQTVKISAVDENGVPTAWEPVDFPSGGGENEWETKTYDFSAESVVAVKFDLPRADITEALLVITATGSNSSKMSGRYYADVEATSSNGNKWLGTWAEMYTTQRTCSLHYSSCGSDKVATFTKNFGQTVLNGYVVDIDRPVEFIYFVTLTADSTFTGTATLYYR